METNTPARSILGEQLSAMQSVLAALPSNKRRELVTLWTVLRKHLEGKDSHIPLLCDENRRLQALSSGGAIIPPERPPSSASVLSIRAALERTLANQAIEEGELAQTSRLLAQLPPQWLLARLRAHRGSESELGCWLSTNAPSRKAYTRDNLRNTKHPVTFELLGINPYRHHMAVAASGRGQQLAAARSGGTHEV